MLVWGICTVAVSALPAQTFSFTRQDFDVPPYLRAPAFVAVGDFNGDGKPDLAVANGGADNILVLIGSGDGTFLPKANCKAGASCPFGKPAHLVPQLLPNRRSLVFNPFTNVVTSA